MKNIKSTFLAGLLIFISTAFLSHAIASEKIQYKKGDSMYVLSVAGLVLRSEADKNASKAALIPYGKQIVIKEDNTGDKPFEVNGIKGYWVKASYNGKEGFAFDGFLSKHPAPDKCTAKCEDFKIIENYADKKLKLKGKPQKSEDDMYIYAKKTYTNGFIIDRKEGQPGLPSFEMTFTMPDVRIAEAFLMLKMMGFSNLRDRAFPSANSKGSIQMLDTKWNDTVEVKKADGDIVNIRISDESVDEMGVGLEVMNIEFSVIENSVVVKFGSGGS